MRLRCVGEYYITVNYLVPVCILECRLRWYIDLVLGPAYISKSTITIERCDLYICGSYNSPLLYVAIKLNALELLL